MSNEYRPLASGSDSTAIQSMSSSKYSFAVFTEIPDSYDLTIDSVVTCRLYCAIELSEEDVIIVCNVYDKKRPVLAKKLLEWTTEDLSPGYGRRSLRMDIKEVLDQLNEDEIYQYVCLRRTRIGEEEEEEVFGASVPFRFKKTVQEDEEEDDFLVVRSEEHCLREQIGKLAEMTEQLQTGSEEQRRELIGMKRQLEEVVKDRDQLLEEKAKTRVDIDQLRDDYKTLSGQLSDQLVRSEELDKELMEMKRKRQEKEAAKKKAAENARVMEEIRRKALPMLECKVFDCYAMIRGHEALDEHMERKHGKYRQPVYYKP